MFFTFNKFNSPKYIYRRQFVLGPRPINLFRDWKCLQIGKSYLAVHPDLEYTVIQKDGHLFVLLGFLLDPYHPDHTNLDILQDLANQFVDSSSFIQSTSHLGGRWILIHSDTNGASLFHDFSGYRQCYYYQNSDGLWCAPTPCILADLLCLPESRDPELLQFISSSEFEITEHAWIGDETVYANVKHLMPNHQIDLSSGEISRYWPNRFIQEISMAEAVPQCCEILQGQFKAASKRWKLAVAVTAGWDSRLLLAATKELHGEITYFVHKICNLDDDAPDIAIPKKLFSQLGIPFFIIPCTQKFDKKLAKRITQNVRFVHKYQKFEEYHSFYYDLKDKVPVGGQISEVARCLYYPDANHPDNVTSKLLSSLHSRKNEPYVVSQCQKWLSEVTPSIYNYKLLDIFYLEQRDGNWGAMFPAGLDTISEQFHPFNCRKLMDIMLSVNSTYRKKLDSPFYQEMISTMWPELLSEPMQKS